MTMKGKILRVFLNNAPYFVINWCMSFLQKIIPPDTEYENLLMYRFAKYFASHYDTVLTKVRNQKRFMTIDHGRFPYEYFNICYLNNVIGLIVYCFYKGYMPVIRICNQTENENIWNWYFEQPDGIDLSKVDNIEKIVPCDRTYTEFRPNVRTGFDPNAEEFAIWSFFYKKYVVFNEQTTSYIENEIKSIGIGDNSLGMLIRGTDYTGLKPSGHPVQPDIKELIKQAEIYNELFHYSSIYVATEEKRLYEEISSVFGANTVKQNKRSYYDEVYYGSDCSYIGEVSFNRENDNFLKGLEYLSSLVILSRCTDLVAGNCGGTEFALLFTNGYRKQLVFNKGLYK